MNNTSETAVCANCGKEGSDVTNTCNKFKAVMYCNAACKKKHRSKHKKACERRVAEMHDEKLFKQPPPLEDCEICFLTMPSLKTGYKYNACCGKRACSGCIYANATKLNDDDLCPFCRTPAPTTQKGIVERLEKRIKVNDAIALFGLGCIYSEGQFGFPQNYEKALELWQWAGELGHAESYYNIGNAYLIGRGVQRDMKKAVYYWEQAAILGHGGGRHNLGVHEKGECNMDRALKHYMISVKDGNKMSLDAIKELYMKGYATKDDYTKALQSYQKYLGEIKSSQRDEAAAFDRDHYRYY